MATLFDKGLFQYEETIGKYWPEFAQNGKENVKICDVLRHESGLAYFKGQAHNMFSQIFRMRIYKFFYQILRNSCFDFFLRSSKLTKKMTNK